MVKQANADRATPGTARAGLGQSAYLHANEVAHVVNGLACTLMSCLKALAEPI